jgi:PEP-CTERM motif
MRTLPDVQVRHGRNGNRPVPLFRAVLASALLLTASAALAAPFIDPVGDFLPTFTGPLNADLDVVRSELTLQGSQFIFSTTLAGPVGGTAGSLYVLGLNRGAGTARFPTLAPGVLFDEVLSVTGTGVATVRDLISGNATTLAANATTISGNGLSVIFPVGLAPSLGLLPSEYTWNLWPRNGAGNNAQISDFAPDNSNVRVTVSAVPEPATLALILLGCLGFAATRRETARRASRAASDASAR